MPSLPTLRWITPQRITPEKHIIHHPGDGLQWRVAIAQKEGTAVDEEVLAGRVVEIAALYRDDPEAAHSEEDRVLGDFVDWIAATGSSYQAIVAGHLRKLLDSPGPRWCA